MNFLRTPAPFPSTIMSLAPSEQFRYRGALIEAITVDPQSQTYTLSGVKEELFGTRKSPRAYGLPRDTPLPTAASALLSRLVPEEFSRYATPVPPAASAHLSPAHVQTPAPARSRSGAHRAGR